MQFEITSFDNNSPIPDEFAFGAKDPQTHIALSHNKNPHLKWAHLPKGTQSLAVICVDPDVPTIGKDVNKAGKSIPKNMPRTDFYHWVLVDINPKRDEIPAGADSKGITQGGKPIGRNSLGVTGVNDYTIWFANDASMKGHYGGYDGPCPPWNDERVHHYHFVLYALDTPSLGLHGPFTGQDAINAIAKHTIDKAEWIGTYSLNPKITLS